MDEKINKCTYKKCYPRKINVNKIGNKYFATLNFVTITIHLLKYIMAVLNI